MVGTVRRRAGGGTAVGTAMNMCELVRPVARHVVARADSPIWKELVREYGTPGTGECTIPTPPEGEIVEISEEEKISADAGMENVQPV